MSRLTGANPARSRPGLCTNDKIDVCRGLFAFLVVIAHALEVTFSMSPTAPAQHVGVTRRILMSTVGTGIYWVMGFFVISGYCIQLSVQRRGQGGAFPLKSYLIARLTRILPLYYLALAFSVLVEWWIASDRPGNWPNGLSYQVLACQVLLIQNLTQTYGSFASSWSITNEAFYYVFYGLLVAGSVRRGRRPIGAGIAICLIVGVLMDLAYHLGLRLPAIGSLGLLFGLGMNWFLGALVAEYRDRVACSARLQAVARRWPLVLAGVIVLRCTILDRVELVMLGSGVAFTLMLIRFLGVDRERADAVPSQTFAHRPRMLIKGLGLASYPTYLLHGPILMAVGSVLIRLGLSPDWQSTWALLAASGIASGIAGGYLIEEPIMTWRAGLLGRIGSSARPRRAAGPARIPIAASR